MFYPIMRIVYIYSHFNILFSSQQQTDLSPLLLSAELNQIRHEWQYPLYLSTQSL